MLAPGSLLQCTRGSSPSDSIFLATADGRRAVVAIREGGGTSSGRHAQTYNTWEDTSSGRHAQTYNTWEGTSSGRHAQTYNTWEGTSSGRHAQTYNTRVQSKVRSLANLAAASEATAHGLGH